MFSLKQRQLIEIFRAGRLRRLNVLCGSVRSGKTWISLVVWAFWVASMPPDSSFIMVAKTVTALRRNVLDLLQALVGTANFTYSISKKEGRLFGRRIFFEGASDSRAEGKIRGMSLSGAYCDEITLIDEDFFAMLLSRLSCPGAKLIGTTNPAGPYHWFKKKYLDRGEKLDLFTMNFLIDDNPFLPADYVQNLKSEYTGVFYDRYILGLWKAAEGLVYPEFAAAPEKYIIAAPPDDIAFAAIGVDFGGNMSAHSFVCTGFTRGFKRAVVLDEFYIKEKISPAQLENYFVSFVRTCKARYPLFDVYCDNAETTLICGLTQAAARFSLGVDVRRAAKTKIVNRIRFFNMLISKQRFLICAHCTHLAEALCSAVWNPKYLDDVRLDNGSVNIDSLDALEYSAESVMDEMMSLDG